MKVLTVLPTSGLANAQDEIIAVSNHNLTLPVNSIFGTIEDVRAARAQFLRQRVNPRHAEIGVTCAIGPGCASVGLICAIEEHLNLISPDDCENRMSIWHEADAPSVPIAGYLETEDVPIVLGCSHQVRHRELGNRRIETNVRRCVFAHLLALSPSYFPSRTLLIRHPSVSRLKVTCTDPTVTINC